jgi:hypothetical protein
VEGERRSCFDKLSTNGKSLTISVRDPFALSLSKGGYAFFLSISKRIPISLMPALNSAALLTAWEEGVSQPLMQRALTLLATAWPERSVDEWARASIGERDGRLIRLREELFGSRLETTTVCPKCGEQLELTFNTQDIQVPMLAFPALLEEGVRMEAAGYEVTCRLPTSADLLEIAKSVATDGRDALLKRCVRVARLGGEVVDPATLPDDVVSAVIAGMAQADPQAEVQIALACVACLHNWSLPFDILLYLWSEIEDWAQRLLLEVHALASAYGWSERDIVAMSPQRRRLYLDMVGA